MIKLKNISVFYNQKAVIKDLSFTFPKKGVVLITGASGSGKTTLARVILGLKKADSGQTETNSAKITAVFQEDRLLPNLNALENVALVSNKEKAEERLLQMELIDAQNLYPSELSGGMKRRVAIARALAFGGDVILLDEALSGIEDNLARRILTSILKEYKDKLVIAVTHRPELFEGTEYTVCPI